MSEANEEEKTLPDAADAATFDADFRPRYPLEQDSQYYSTVTDLARLRG